MKTFLTFLFESVSVSEAKEVSKAIDRITDNVPTDTGGYKDCHASVHTTKSRSSDLFIVFQSGVKFYFGKLLKFVMWDESKWDQAAKYIEQHQEYKKLKSKYVIGMLDDIAMGTINGHSYIKYDKKWYIDPHLSSAGVSFEEIQAAGKYFDTMFRALGQNV